jgi:hypothetical protein
MLLVLSFDKHFCFKHSDVLDIHGSVHHDTIFTKMNNNTQLRKIIYYSLTALYVLSDIFAHHQGHPNRNYSFWFYSRVSWSAAVMVA